jgi:hypothetical protein
MNSSGGVGPGYQPYLSSDSELSDEDDGRTSVTGSETSGTSDEEREIHDGQMQALDVWRSTAQSWISGPAAAAGQLVRPLPATAAMPPVGRRPAGAPRAGVVNLPLELRANDIRRHIINIDSMFRENPLSSTAGDFWWHLLSPLRNIMRIRITSVELPNNFKFFSAARRYSTITVIKGANEYTLTVPDGNYLIDDMIDTLNQEINSIGDIAGITVDFSEVTGKFTFCAPFDFAIDTVSGSHERPIAYGLGWFLGFSRGVHEPSFINASGDNCIISDGCANFAGDNYLLLKVNDFDCVTHTVCIYHEGRPAQENAITALAKLVLREPKNFMTYDDYASQHIKEVVFQNPRDLLRFHVRLLDSFGDVVDMCSSQISFSLEVTEVLNPSMFDAVRDSMMLQYV